MQMLTKMAEHPVVGRTKGFYLLLVGTAIAVQFVAVAAYDADAGLEGSAFTVWRILDVLMVVGVVLVLVVSLGRKMAIGSGEALTREYMEANVSFYLAAALCTGLLSNWIRVEFTEGWDNFLWVLLDMILPPLFISNGVQLLRAANRR